jgi:hypothetical protein
MGETEDRKREARRTDQEIKDEQELARDLDRDERARRLKIGEHREQ